MKTRDLMIPDPITISADASVQDALQVMKTNSIRHLPVVSDDGRFIGLLTLADLKQGLIPSMLADVTLSDLMIRNAIRIGPDDDIEIAAQMIYKHKISGLPVIEDDILVGILTESDIFRAFIDMMGLLSATSRIDVAMGEDPEGFKRALQIITDNGGDVINIGMTPVCKKRRVYYFRLTSCKTAGLCHALKTGGFEVLGASD